MPGKRDKTKEIVTKLLQAEMLQAQLRAELQPLLLHSMIR